MNMDKKYGALPFDPNDSHDLLAEHGRKMLLETALREIANGSVPDSDHLQYLLGGMMVGLVQVAKAHLADSDDSWASVRASIAQLTPWAVDQARSISGLPPLSDT